MKTPDQSIYDIFLDPSDLEVSDKKSDVRACPPPDIDTSSQAREDLTTKKSILAFFEKPDFVLCLEDLSTRAYNARKKNWQNIDLNESEVYHLKLVVKLMDNAAAYFYAWKDFLRQQALEKKIANEREIESVFLSLSTGFMVYKKDRAGFSDFFAEGKFWDVGTEYAELLSCGVKNLSELFVKWNGFYGSVKK